jgi:hypothetical protein
MRSREVYKIAKDFLAKKGIKPTHYHVIYTKRKKPRTMLIYDVEGWEYNFMWQDQRIIYMKHTEYSNIRENDYLFEIIHE